MVRKSDNVPILIDFGLSKQYDFNGDATSTIMQGVSHGFSPIELYNANSISSFSPASDIYSLGATLYYLLTGIVPPSASQILEDGISIPANISMAVGQLIERTMVPVRNKRPSTPDVMCEIRSLNNIGRDDREVRDKEVETKSPQSVLEETILAPDSSDLDLNTVEYTKLQETILLLDEELRSKTSDISQHKDLLAKKNNEINVLQRNNSDLNNQISELSSQVVREHESKDTAWTVCIVSIVILSIVCIATISSKLSKIERINKEIEQVTSMKNLLADSLNNYKSALTQRDNIINTIAQNTDVFISDIEVRNKGEYYGEKIYSRNTTFINPRFKVINLSDNSKDIGVKFYAPFGLATGKTSKDGYSFTQSIPAKYGSNSETWYEASGWGNEEKGNWMAGKYRIEFWADGKCIATKHFTIF